MTRKGEKRVSSTPAQNQSEVEGWTGQNPNAESWLVSQQQGSISEKDTVSTMRRGDTVSIMAHNTPTSIRLHFNPDVLLHYSKGQSVTESSFSERFPKKVKFITLLISGLIKLFSPPPLTLLSGTGLWSTKPRTEGNHLFQMQGHAAPLSAMIQGVTCSLQR